MTLSLKLLNKILQMLLNLRRSKTGYYIPPRHKLLDTLMYLNSVFTLSISTSSMLNIPFERLSNALQGSFLKRYSQNQYNVRRNHEDQTSNSRNQVEKGRLWVKSPQCPCEHRRTRPEEKIECAADHCQVLEIHTLEKRQLFFR